MLSRLSAGGVAPGHHGAPPAAGRHQQRVLGLPTGFSQFVNLLGGLTEGLYLLANAPGMGQTTLAL